MEKEENILRTNYKRGRTVEELETERLQEVAKRTGEENINVLFGLISLNKKLKTAIFSNVSNVTDNLTFISEKHEGVFELWNTLNKNGVRYILIGNFASHFHGVEHFTPTIEIFIDNDLENKINLGNALEELNISTVKEIITYQFNKGWMMLNLSNGYPLDIVTTVEGLENIGFDLCYQLASTVNVEGITLKFLHFEHLLESKKAIDRPKEQLELLILQALKKEKL